MSLVTSAVLPTVPTARSLIVPVTTTSTLVPVATVGIVQVTAPWSQVAPAAVVEMVPRMIAVGSVSPTMTPCASEGPVLLTVIV